MNYTKYLALSLIALLSSAPVSARRGESAEEKKLLERDRRAIRHSIVQTCDTLSKTEATDFMFTLLLHLALFPLMSRAL